MKIDLPLKIEDDNALEPQPPIIAHVVHESRLFKNVN